MKCAKCGHIELYWRADWHDVEREYAKTEDVIAERAKWPYGLSQAVKEAIGNTDHQP